MALMKRCDSFLTNGKWHFAEKSLEILSRSNWPKGKKNFGPACHSFVEMKVPGEAGGSPEAALSSSDLPVCVPGQELEELGGQALVTRTTSLGKHICVTRSSSQCPPHPFTIFTSAGVCDSVLFTYEQGEVG